MTNVMDLLKRRRPLAKSFRPASEASADCLALWRPAWEVSPLLWHVTASAFALGLWSGGVLSGCPALALGGIPAGLALKRITEAQRIWKERSRLSGHAPAFMSFADLALVMRSFETPRLSPDEPRSAINPPLIEILNKGMEAGFQCVCAMQTISDLEARLGSAAQARMALGNLNNLIALRTKDEATQKFIAEAFGRTTIWETAASVTTTAGASALPAFRAAASSSLSGRRDSVVPLEALGQLPNLEFFASLSGGRLWKGRMPILDPALEGLHLYAQVTKVPAPIERWRAFLEARVKCLKSQRSAALGRHSNGEKGDSLK